MIDEKKLIAEIERLKTEEYYYTHDEYDGFVRNALDKVVNFINSIPEEPVSEDLNKAARRYAALQAGMKDAMTSNYYEEYPYSPNDIEAFKAGAQWQKEQMMAKAVDGDITFDYYGDGDKTYGCIAHDSFCLEDFGLKDRDKVKVIVIKED